MPDPITWKEDDARAGRCFVEQFPDHDGTSALNIFRDISAPIFDLLVIETNRYASQKNDHSFTVSSSEIQKLVGVIILSVYNIRRSFRDYWSKAKTLQCRAFTETMIRSRFQQMKSYLHMCNNDAFGPKKLTKVLPICDLLNVTMKRFGILLKILSVDESMVPWFGRLSCKQFFRGKPIRFVFKLWVISSSAGVPYHVSIYEGNEDGANNEPLGSRVVEQTVDACIFSNQNEFFDNFFHIL